MIEVASQCNKKLNANHYIMFRKLHLINISLDKDSENGYYPNQRLWALPNLLDIMC